MKCVIALLSYEHRLPNGLHGPNICPLLSIYTQLPISDKCFTHPHVQNPLMAPADQTRVPSPQTRSQGFHHLAMITLVP